MENSQAWEKAREKLLKEAEKGCLPCRKALEIAQVSGISTSELGQLCNEMKIKIIHCQLGCF